MSNNRSPLGAAWRRAWSQQWWLALVLALATGAGLATTVAVQTSLAASDGPSAKASVVDVNRASVEELQALPGIGEARARAIVERRQTQGAFTSVEELREIRGIGDAMVERLRPHVKVDGRATPRAR